MNGTAIVLTALTAFVVTSALGIWLIPFLKRLKYGQTILDIGPVWHKSKQGIPTMGGIMFIAGITAAVLVGFFTMAASAQGFIGDQMLFMQHLKLFAGLVMALAFAAVGFVDDYIKVVKKRNLGLTEKQKLVLQILITLLYLTVLYALGDRSTILEIPFLGQLDIGLLYYPLAVFTIVGFVNAVNLTDGLDGLCSSVTFVYSIAFMIISSILGFMDMNLLSTALAGGCIGFLVWNFYPAKIFMGDTGSMFLGGLVIALAFGTNLPMFILLVGIIYLVEAFSVILQVISVKTTGKRIFKMSPIHHHFEMSGYTEVKIVTLFSLITFIGGAVAVIAVHNI
ncbi:MAG TPA: phospho-N-acetylmuramoyl-pentapeptide-transferase [Ruminococcaceae bacterium]|nr:phospho-N-acetylmuramoyl-pentapeptide-transferase [Oscillospiraceae bacterium]